jgi:ribonuclease PH
VELEKLNGFQVILDCDVIQADGGTRTASISGSFVALNLALKKFIKKDFIKSNPVKDYVAAISCGIVNGKVLVDLDYDEDSSADVDANFIMTKKSGFSEIQISGENSTFNYQSVTQMVDITKKIVNQIFDIQKNAIK